MFKKGDFVVFNGKEFDGRLYPGELCIVLHVSEFDTMALVESTLRKGAVRVVDFDEITEATKDVSQTRKSCKSK